MKNELDWPQIKLDYTAGFTISEITHTHGVLAKSVINRSKAEDWKVSRRSSVLESDRAVRSVNRKSPKVGRVPITGDLRNDQVRSPRVDGSGASELPLPPSMSKGVSTLVDLLECIQKRGELIPAIVDEDIQDVWIRHRANILMLLEAIQHRVADAVSKEEVTLEELKTAQQVIAGTTATSRLLLGRTFNEQKALVQARAQAVGADRTAFSFINPIIDVSKPLSEKNPAADTIPS